MRKRNRADGGANVGSVDISGGGCEFISMFPRARVADASRRVCIWLRYDDMIPNTDVLSPLSLSAEIMSAGCSQEVLAVETPFSRTNRSAGTDDRAGQKLVWRRQARKLALAGSNRESFCIDCIAINMCER